MMNKDLLMKRISENGSGCHNGLRILLTAFRNTSSEKLIRCFGEKYHTLILENDKAESIRQLYSGFDCLSPDYAICFGQKPVIRDKLYIETAGRSENTCRMTSFDTDRLVCALEQSGLSVRISDNAGTSFCNNLYFHGLEYIKKNSCGIKMVFIHIPFEKNISDFSSFSERLDSALDIFFG